MYSQDYIALNSQPVLLGRRAAVQSQMLCSPYQEPLTAAALNNSDPLAGCTVLSTWSTIRQACRPERR